jgi:hypothetical protein
MMKMGFGPAMIASLPVDPRFWGLSRNRVASSPCFGSQPARARRSPSSVPNWGGGFCRARRELRTRIFGAGKQERPRAAMTRFGSSAALTVYLDRRSHGSLGQGCVFQGHFSPLPSCLPGFLIQHPELISGPQCPRTTARGLIASLEEVAQNMLISCRLSCPRTESFALSVKRPGSFSIRNAGKQERPQAAMTRFGSSVALAV